MAVAHIEKYKVHSVGHMLAHYRRDPSSLGRENIDSNRLSKNRTILPGSAVAEPNWGTVKSRIEAVDAAAKKAGKRRTRSDAVVMADLVVTLPEDVRQGDEDVFWETVYYWLAEKVGAENMLGGFVHRDEVRADGTPARDHMHAAFTPILNGRFNYKEMCPRGFYQTMHRGLGDALEARLGYRPAIELDEAGRARRIYTERSGDVDRVRAAIVEPAEREADELRAEADELEARLECLRATERAIAGDVGDLEAIAGLVSDQGREGRGQKGPRLDEIAGRCLKARREAGERWSRVRDLWQAFAKGVDALWEKVLGKPQQHRSLAEQARAAYGAVEKDEEARRDFCPVAGVRSTERDI